MTAAVGSSWASIFSPLQAKPKANSLSPAIPCPLRPSAAKSAVGIAVSLNAGVLATVFAGVYMQQGRRKRPVCLRQRALGGTPWETLGVPQGASQSEIKRAYRRKALKEHPDVSKLPDAKQRWQELSAAYDALSDPEKLRAWDRARKASNGQRAQRGSQGSGSGGFSGSWKRTQAMEEEYDTGGDSFGAIFSDFMTSVSETANETSKRSPGGRARQAGSMLLEDLLDFLEKGLGEEASSASKDSPFSGSNPEKELQETQLELSTMRSRDETLRYEAEAWERKAQLCRDAGDKAGELEGMQRLFETRERRKTIRRRLLSLTERAEYLQKVIFEFERKQAAKKQGSSQQPPGATSSRSSGPTDRASAKPGFDADAALANLKRQKGRL